MLSPTDRQAALRALATGLSDPGFCCEVVALMTRCGFICPNTPKLREWLAQTARYLKAQGIRRADLRFLLIQKFDVSREEADRILQAAEAKNT
jgi:hypothetical protein